MFGKIENDVALVGAVEKIMEENAIRRKADELVQESLGLRNTFGIPLEVRNEYNNLREGFAADLLEAGVKLMEVSAERLKSYVKKAKSEKSAEKNSEHKNSLAMHRSYDSYWNTDDGNLKKHFAKKTDEYEDKTDQAEKNIKKRSSGIKTASKKLSEDEQLDEVSKERLGSYVKKAKISYAVKAGHAMVDGHKGKDVSKDDSRKLHNKGIGIDRAVDRLTKEENEQLDEVSKERLKDYQSKADASVGDLARKGAKWTPGDAESRKKADGALGKAFRRSHMSGLANRKVRGDVTHPILKPKVLAKEENERLDEVSKERLKAYIGKASENYKKHREDATESGRKAKVKGLSYVGRGKHNNAEYKSFTQARKRASGIGAATKKLADKD